MITRNGSDIRRENIKMGMTTWAEISEISNARSDCHAWGRQNEHRTVPRVLALIQMRRFFEGQDRATSRRHHEYQWQHSTPKWHTWWQAIKQENGKWKISIDRSGKNYRQFVVERVQYSLKTGANKFNL